MSRPREESVSFTGPAGHIEGVLHLPDAEPHAVAVVCHPHPQHQGTMDNKVVHTLARAFAGLGMAALRFNFRGVSGSEGDYDEGVGEVDDALAAVGVLRDRFGRLPVWFAGFSFGSFVALQASHREACAGLVMIAPAVRRFDYAAVPPPDCRALVVQGDADDIAPPDAVVEWVNAVFPSPDFALLPGVGHFFHGQLTRLRDIVTEFVEDA